MNFFSATIVFILALGVSSSHGRHIHALHRRQDPAPVVVANPGEPAPAPAPTASVTISYALNQPTMTVADHAAGSKPSSLPSAPGLPAPFVLTPGNYPAPDATPPSDSPEVLEWLKELDGHDIPDLQPTQDGTCANDTEAAAASNERGWWTCGGPTRDTDIASCPNKGDWGVTFDDGPADYTPTLLNYLGEEKISATFFLIGSRILEKPNVVVDTYIRGHEIGLHTWSHSSPLTSLTNAEIVAELGWTRRLIKEIVGVTPITMRPPQGDIDDRVRAISMAMGLIPVMWTRMASGVTVDTNDWRIGTGLSIEEASAAFKSVLDQASNLDTGFVALQHDNHEIAVTLAIESTLKAATERNPPFKLLKVGECLGFPESNLYRETSRNATFPWGTVSGSVDIDGDGTAEVKVLAPANPSLLEKAKTQTAAKTASKPSATLQIAKASTSPVPNLASASAPVTGGLVATVFAVCIVGLLGL